MEARKQAVIERLLRIENEMEIEGVSPKTLHAEIERIEAIEIDNEENIDRKVGMVTDG